MKVSKIGIVSRFDQQDALDMVRKIYDEFNSKVEIFFSPKTGKHLGIKQNCLPVEQMKEAGVQLIISVGGDGTVLRNISKMDEPLPVLGINMGTLGFLVDVPPEDAIKDIADVLKGFSYTERSRLSVHLNGKRLQDATNEIVLITARPAKILTFRITVDNSEIEDMRADGIVVATPTGSTAYSMSAGGPIVDPRVNASIIVPIAPFKLSARPWIVPGDSNIKVEMTIPEKEAALVIDGQHSYNMKENDIVTVTRAENPARFVSSSINGFYEKVQSKLS
ncbi:NAD(+)/NADH kinase [Methanolobus bombayensis]|uniref:NAD(+)/NADH kinase n=1 Tax=Methanolobus bombayensis TaxID=38023 RepID=UPI001AE1CC52|nr:NAD(+)/NADH kinase [Methanolobus bombayensis]MBP1909008.1 NAD+ kinase [Methanolobus bombayensis]